MKIDVRDQVSLSLRKCFQLCVRGIRYRLFRSAITVVIVALAVAFLMMMLATSYVDRAVAGDVRQRIAGRRLLDEWVDKLTVPMTQPALAGRLAHVEEGSVGWAELANWGGLGDEQLRRLTALALQQRQYQRYLARLQPGQRSSLVGARLDEAVFKHLVEPGKAGEFYAKVRKLPTRFPGGEKALLQFLRDYTETAPLREQILLAHAAAVAGLKQELGAGSVLDMLASADDKTVATLKRFGFVPEVGELAALGTEAVLAEDARELASLLREERMRGVIASRVGVNVAQVSDAHVFEVGASPDGARWLIQEVERTRQKILEKAGGKPVRVPEPLRLPPERIAQVARAQQEQARLAGVEARLSAETEGDWMGFSGRTAWLILISFVVCVVGVANAMLMSVTERFREIATMKCLGALDSFIMIIFVMESALQGLAGGVIGIVLGLLLGVARSWWNLGTLVLANLPGLMLLASAGVCLASGAVLASLAAVYPAWVAARLAPMEAMRIE